MQRLNPPPSPEVQQQARARAEALAEGLFAHQIEGIAFLLGRARTILADDMGLGKTRQSVIAMKEAKPIGPYLVVCPASVKQNWRREILKVLPNARVEIVGPAPLPADHDDWVVINYDLLNRNIDGLLAMPWQGLVFDEAHYLKNHTSQRSRTARKLAESVNADATIHVLTGTPLTNRPRDLFPLLQLTRHPMGRSFLSFAKRYCDAYQNDYGWVTDGASNLDELRIVLQGLMLRRTKDEVLDLPPKVRTWLPIEIARGTGRSEARRVLEMLLRGDDSRVDLLSHLTRAREKIAIGKTKQTIELVEGAVMQDEKVVVFSCFHTPVEIIAKHFGANALMLTGKTPQAQRQPIVDRFQNEEDARVLVANIIAGGVGLNLTAARQVLFNDLDWVPANHWQAEDRAYRIGQTGTVNVTYMVALGTIDEFVAATLQAKTALIDAVVEDAEAANADVFAALQDAVAAMSPRMSELADDGDDMIDRLLRRVTRDFERKEQRALQRERTLNEDAIVKLAEVLSGPKSARFRMQSSRDPNVWYELEVDGPDIICNCPGFEYRGNCAHARTLRQQLENGTADGGHS